MSNKQWHHFGSGGGGGFEEKQSKNIVELFLYVGHCDSGAQIIVRGKWAIKEIKGNQRDGKTID
jgi:hypothetical protein